MVLMDAKGVGLCLLLYVEFYIVFSLNCDLTTRSCPSTMSEWNERERVLNCIGERYTCIMTNERILVEACMWNSKIMSGTVGCPYIAACDSTDGPILISGEKYFSCPETPDGCPKSNHTGYSVSDMYKFPRCWIIDKATKLLTTIQPNPQNPTTPDHRQIYAEVQGDKHVPHPTIFGIGIPVAVIVIGVIFILVYISKKRCFRNKGEYIEPSRKAVMNKV